MKQKNSTNINNIIVMTVLSFIMLFTLNFNVANAEVVWQISEEEIEKFNQGVPGEFPGGYAGENTYKYCFYYNYEKNGENIEREVELYSGTLNMPYEEFNKTNIEALIPKEDLYLSSLSSNELYALLCKHIAIKEKTTPDQVSEMINSGEYVMKKCFAYISVNIKLKRDDSFLGSTYDRMKGGKISSSWLKLGFDKGKLTPESNFMTKYEDIRLYDYRNYANVGVKNLETWFSKVKKYNLDFNSKVEFYDQTYESKNYSLSKIISASVEYPINMELIPTPKCSENFIFRGWYTEKNGKGTQVLNENNQIASYRDADGNLKKNYRLFSIRNLKLYAFYLCKVTPYIREEDGNVYRYQVNSTNFDFLVGYGNKLSDAYDPVISTTSPITIDGEVHKLWYNENGEVIYTYTYEIIKNQNIYINKGKEDRVNIKYMIIDSEGNYVEYESIEQPLLSPLSSANVPAMPVVNGYVGYGWMTEKDGKGSPISYGQIVDSDKVFYGFYKKKEIINYEEPYVEFTVLEDKEWYNQDIEVIARVIIPPSFYVDGKVVNTKTNEKKNAKILLDSIKTSTIISDGVTIMSNTNGEIKFKVDKESLNAVNSWLINAEYILVPSGKTKDVDISTLSTDWKIENAASISCTVNGVSKIFRLDKKAPEYNYKVINKEDSTRQLQIEVKDNLSGIQEAYVTIDGEKEDITDTLKFNRIGSDTSTHNILIYAKDRAGNVLTIDKLDEIDDTAPIVKYAFITGRIAENKIATKNRLEAPSNKAEYYLYVSDEIAGETSTGIKEARYIITNEAGLVDGKSIKTSGRVLNTFNKFVRLEIPNEYIKSGKDTYLIIYAIDNAGNETYTLKSNVVYPNEFIKNSIVNDGTSPLKNGYVGPAKNYDAHITLREIPTGRLYINGSNLTANAPLKILSTHDVKWSKTINNFISVSDFPIYKNKFNDTTGLGYRVDFAYEQVGFGTDNEDVTNVRFDLYGKVGNTYKKVYVYEKKSDGSYVKANIKSDYYERNYIKRDNNAFTGNQSSIPIGKAEYKTIDNDNSVLYFNYLIPATAKFKYDIGGTEVEYKGNEILITVDINSKKYMDSGNNTLYNLFNDNLINYTSNEAVYYGIRKRAEGVDKIQAFWYDLAITALDDISGGR